MVGFPCAVIASGNILRVVDVPEPFKGPDGTQHPASAWTVWTDAEFSSKCPGWRLLPVVDTPPSDAEKVITKNEKSQWQIGSSCVTVTYSQREKTPEEVKASSLAQAQAELAATDAQFNPRWIEDIESGTPFQSYIDWKNKRVQLRELIRKLSGS